MYYWFFSGEKSLYDGQNHTSYLLHHKGANNFFHISLISLINAVTALDAVLQQNPMVLPTMFVTQGNGVKNNVGLEVVIKADTRSDERNDATGSSTSPTHLYCVPNIVKDATTLVFHAPEDCEGIVYITDDMGKTVKTISIGARTGINTLRLEELSSLKGGVYAATIKCDRLLQSTRFIKN